MRFWDSSALLPLLVADQATDWLATELRRDLAVVAWWGTPVECAAVLGRMEQQHQLSRDAVRTALTRLDTARRQWIEVPPIEDIRRQSMRLLRAYPLGIDAAMQIAAAIIAADFIPADLPFVTLDGAQAEAAEREGFAVTMPPNRLRADLSL